MPSYNNMTKQDRYFHNLRFLHFTDNRNAADWAGKNLTDYGKCETYLEF
jgi:hypothetical protein